MSQRAGAAEKTKPHHGKDGVYWNLQWNIPLRWVGYFAPLGERNLLNFHWDPVVLL